jgi:hypothetical protein
MLLLREPQWRVRLTALLLTGGMMLAVDLSQAWVVRFRAVQTSVWRPTGMLEDVMQFLKAIVLSIFAVIFSTDFSFAQDWFLSGENNCSGNPAAISAFSALLPISYPLKSGGGNLYMTVDAGSATSLLSGEKIVDSLTLDANNAKSYSTAMDTVTEDYQLPYVVEVDGAILGALAPPVVGLPAGLLFSYVVSKVNAKLASLRSMVLFVAAGGRLERRIKLLRNTDSATYAITSLEYVVSLGNEKRRFLTQGCTYPVNVVVKEFETNEAVGNKIIKVRTSPSAWGVWDIEDNKWDSSILKFDHQDKEFYYFSEDAIENGSVVGQDIHRISFQGGRWQVKRASDGAGGNFKNISSPGIKIR